MMEFNRECLNFEVNNMTTVFNHVGGNLITGRTVN